jgi:hypothetical protein
MDSPGLFDTKLPNETIQRHIEEAIRDLPPHVFLFVHRLDQRFTDEDYNTFRGLKTRFGQSFLDHTIAVFTYGDTLAQKKTTFEQYSADSNQMKTMLRDIAGRFIVLDNTLGPAESEQQIKQLIDMTDHMDGSCYLNPETLKRQEAEAREKECIRKQQEIEQKRKEAELAERERIRKKEKELEETRKKELAEERKRKRALMRRKQEEASAKQQKADTERNLAVAKSEQADRLKCIAAETLKDAKMSSVGSVAEGAFALLSEGIISGVLTMAGNGLRAKSLYDKADSLFSKASSLEDEASYHRRNASRMEKEAKELENEAERLSMELM